MTIKDRGEFKKGLKALLRELSSPVKFALFVTVVYAIILIIDHANINLRIIPYDSDPYNVNGVADFELFKNQAESILNGELIYRDVYADSPPLIIYLLVIPYLVHLLTGVLLETCYKGFYAAIVVMISTIALVFYKKYNGDIETAVLGLCTAFHPFMIVFTFWSASDELIAALMVVTAVILFERGNGLTAAVFAGLAFQTKFYPFLVVVYIIARSKGLLTKIKITTVSGVVAVLPFMPFVILDPGFTAVFQQRFISGYPAHGTGLFAALSGMELIPQGTVILEVLKMLFIVMMVFAAGILLMSKTNNPENHAIMLVAFFISYPQFYAVYTVMIIPFMLVMATKERISLIAAIIITTLVSITAIAASIGGMIFLVSAVLLEAAMAGWLSWLMISSNQAGNGRMNREEYDNQLVL